MTRWGLFFWPIWLITTSVSFLIPEIYAIVTNPANTLSDYAWGELHVYGGEHLLLHSVAWWATLIATLIAMAALIFHIWFKGLAPA